ncbi:tellurite resistance methyltransferase TehB [Ignatzschineria sp. LJL83]
MSIRKPANYYQETYGLTAPHSDVVEMVENHAVKPCKVLDLGCGQGRNSLFLADRGFDVTSYDLSPNMIESLLGIIAKEGIRNIHVEQYDINHAEIKGQYDLIMSTVVLMFVNRENIPAIITDMQNHTNTNGYNLIVSAMSTEAYPFTDFPFTFSEGELQKYYQDWEIIHYNENVGELHRLDADGNRLKLQFATMLAKKI